MFFNLHVGARKAYTGFLINFMFFGISLTLLGATLPKIIRFFNWSYIEAGIVLSAGALGYFSSSLLSGFLLKKVSMKKIFCIGLLLESAAFFLFARLPFPWFNFLMHLLIGIGQGCTEVVTNYSVISMDRNNESRLMNFMHASFCVGAIAGPFIIGSLLLLVGDWRIIYPSTGIMGLLILTLFFKIPMSAPGEHGIKQEKKNSGISSPFFLFILSVMLFLYVGIEIGFSDWISEYFVKRYEITISRAAFSVSLYWTGILTGRLLLSFGYRGNRQEIVLSAILSVSAAALLLIFLFDKKIPVFVFTFFTGLGFSGVYPMIMFLVGRHFGSGSAVGIAATGGGMGSFFFPFIMGYLAEISDLRISFFFLFLVNVVLVLVSVSVYLRLKKHRQPPKQIL